ncbi:hypothetical protein SAMN05444172_1610 [Burkholderia sp. GAS332]|uniref:hypothetical protein n=1 Tax=Paraburkholderia domus TaxID=2793075 RepID=UPI000927053C|nr:hypothetical protein [Paraburkholderia domus]CAE6851248.1 hypothetical protein R75483_07608 [Paraburkholderia domus]SIO39922.1 hypothetical protein SAMN05444172_1610 [Burkholderia sp. GAS332]
MDFTSLTDDNLDDMRATAKIIDNPSARWVPKGGHKEKNLTLTAERDPSEKYRVFVRISVSNQSVFSAGLVRIYPSGETLVLLRYNGGYHPHRNVIERNKVPAVCHRHIATSRYIRAGYDADGYAEPIADYNSVEGAFECLCRDCGIERPEPDTQQVTLNFD